MKITKQRFMAVLLALCLIVGVLPVNSLAAAEINSFDATGGKVTYEIVDGETVTITGCDRTVTAIEIPNTIENLPVTKIADDAFYNGSYDEAHAALTSVKLPSTLIEIGQRAFHGCENLSNVDLTACTALTMIREGAFAGNVSLTSVDFPKSLKYLGDYSFNTCGLTAVDLSGCTELLAIGEGAFHSYNFVSDNAKLAVVKLPPNVKTIRAHAFDSCKKLASVNFSDCKSLNTIEEYAFSISGLTSVTLPASVYDIDPCAFAACPQLTKADLSACTNLTVIENSLFSNCNKLSSVKLPASVNVINENAFSFCTSLSKVDLSACLSLTEIGEKAFYGDTALSDLKLSKTLTYIGKEAFNSCTALNKLDLSVCTSLYEIGEFAFNRIPVDSLSFPASLEVIGRGAFNECENLTSVTWPKNSKLTVLSGFSGCTSLPVSVYNEGVFLPNVTEIGDEAFRNNYFESVTIPANIRKIGCCAFDGDGDENYRSKLKSVTIMPGVETIGEMAFDGCPIEGTLNIPETVNEIGYRAFAETKITGLNIASGVETIGENAFYYCDGLFGKIIVVPESVSLVGREAFMGVDSEKPLTVEFRNRNIKLQEASYCQGQLTIGEQEYYSPFAYAYTCVNVVIRAYEKDSNGDPSMMKLLYDALVSDPDKDPDQVYKFESISDNTCTVSGTLPKDAQIKLYINGQELPTELVNGKFSALADKGATVSADVTMNGYYDKHFIKTDIDEDWDLGEIAFTDKEKIPANRLMLVEFQDTSISNFDNLNITLKDKNTILTEGKDYVLQYPYIALNDTVTADSLTLTIDADKICCTGDSVTADRESGVFKVSLTPWGKLNITADSTFAGDNNILVFDSNGLLVGRSTIVKNGLFITDSLKSGTYTVIAFNANDSFSAVSSVEALNAMGLKKDKDYTEQSVKVTDNKSTEVKLTVPLLKTSVADILNQNNCTVIAEQNKAVVGQSFRTRVYYSFVDSKTGVITAALPKGTELEAIYSQTEVLKKNTDYTVDGDIVTIPVKKSDGMFYMTLKFTKPGEQSLSVSGTVKNVTAPIGSVTLQVQGLFLEPASQILTTRTDNVANITAAPDSYVELLLDGKKVASGTTKKSGTLRLTYDLPADTLNGQQFKLKAVCGNESSETTVSCVVNVERKSGLETWYFYWGDKKEPLFSMFDENIKSSYIVYSGEYVYFAATFIGESEPSNVITYVGMTNGDVEYVPMSLLKTEKFRTSGKEETRYTFSGKMKATTRVAENFAIDWEDDSEYFSYDTTTSAQIQKQVDKIINNRKEIIADRRAAFEDKLEGVVPEIDDASQYIFGAKYRMSDTAWFKSLSESEQTATYNLEKAIDRDIGEISKAYGLEKDLTEYSGWDEVYAELGIKQSKNTRTADELRADGFTVCENGKTFTAYKDYTEETQPQTQKLRTMSASLRSAGGVSGVTGGFTFIDGDGNQVDFQGNAMGNIQQSIRNGQIADLTDAYNDFADVIKSNPSCGGLQAGILNGVSGGLQITNDLLSLDNIRQDAEAMVDFTVQAAELQGYIDELKLFENRYADKPLCSNSIMRERHIAESIHLLLDNEAFRSGANAIAGSVTFAAGVFDKTGATDVVGNVWDKATNTVGARRAAEIENLLEKLDKQTRVRKQQCEKTDMEDIMRRTRKTAHKKGLVDPSGIVYEAVESNTLEGVKATVWYAEDENGTNARIWDADAYDQINPQITDKSGMYAWDVTTGWWQVRFEKEGYELAQTEWMQVPPPRLGLKTAMVSTALPKVLTAKAYPDYIEVMFSQYMDTAKEITLPEGMTGTWQSVDSGYSKILHITKEGGFKKGSTVSFTLDGAQNYAGKALDSYNSGELTVSARPAEIILNYESVISAKAGTARNITVRIKDTDGNYMSDVSLQAVIDNADFAKLAESTAITDESGKAVFSMNTELPGYTNITFTVEGSSLTKTVALDITLNENRPQRPTAQIGAVQYTADSPKENYITIKNGEQLVISAEDGVTIYYTTDDTCPCQNSDGRKIYTGPITITENTKFRITAYKDGMDYSERLNITVTVDDTHQHSYSSEWKSDTNGHWHECSCGAVSDRAAHDWKLENEKSATTTEPGYTGDKTCKVCGYEVKGKEIPATGKTDPVNPGDDTPTEPVNPGDNTPTDPTTPGNDKPANTNGDGKNANSPKTGDNSDILLWFAALFLSGTGILGTTVYNKKKKHVK